MSKEKGYVLHEGKLNAHVHGIASERQAKRVALSLLGENAVINDIYKTKGPQV